MNETFGGKQLAAANDRKLFEGIFSSAMDAIIAVDAGFKVLAFNHAAEVMFGVEAREVLGHSLERFIPARFRADHAMHVARFAATSETHRSAAALGTVTGLRSDGEEFRTEASIAKVIVDGAPVFTVILREAMQQQDTGEAAILAREVDHRARNILATVSSLISLSVKSGEEKRTEGLAGRVDALARANSLLSVKRWKGAALTRLIRDELQAQCRHGRFSLDGPDVMLSSRSVQPLGLLFHELATNAAQHGSLTQQKGVVYVSWQDEQDGSLRLVWREDGGPAVSKPSSHGLGLTLASRILEAQLGAVFTLDWRAEGLRFTAKLPSAIRDCRRAPTSLSTVEDSALVTDGPVPASKGAGTAPGRLLIVEDEQIIATQLSRALGNHGWTVVGAAGTLDAAFALLAKAETPDAAILDVDLGGVAVFPFARALRQLGIPFLFCTGFDDVAYNREFLDCTVVRKPATALQVVAALRTLVGAAA